MKLKIHKIFFINILILIFIYFISLLLGKKIIQEDNYYFKIPLNLDLINEYNHTIYSPALRAPDINANFFIQFINYLKYEKNIKKNICPEDIFEYGSRNINIFDVNLPSDYLKSFSISIKTVDKNLDMDECVKLVFISMLNEYYNKELSFAKRIVNNKLNFMEAISKEIQNPMILYEIKNVEYSYFKLNSIQGLVNSKTILESKIDKKISSSSKIFLSLFFINCLIQILIFFTKNKKKSFSKFFGL